jgi:hypothetical protein
MFVAADGAPYRFCLRACSWSKLLGDFPIAGRRPIRLNIAYRGASLLDAGYAFTKGPLIYREHVGSHSLHRCSVGRVDPCRGFAQPAISA